MKTLEEPVGAACIVLAAEDPATLLPTVVSRVARTRLGPVEPGVIVDLLAERGLADAARGTAIARAAGGRPGIAIALAADPEAMLTVERLARSLLDLTFADRRSRLAAVPDLLTDGAVLDEVFRRAAAAELGQQASAEQTTGPKPSSRRSTGTSRPAPAERRRAVLRVLHAWRDIARDLAIVADADARTIRHPQLIDDLRAASRIDRRALVDFLERLDGLIVAVESYANPELTMDALVLDWPQARRVA